MKRLMQLFFPPGYVVFVLAMLMVSMFVAGAMASEIPKSTTSTAACGKMIPPAIMDMAKDATGTWSIATKSMFGTEGVIAAALTPRQMGQKAVHKDAIASGSFVATGTVPLLFTTTSSRIVAKDTVFTNEVAYTTTAEIMIVRTMVFASAPAYKMLAA